MILYPTYLLKKRLSLDLLKKYFYQCHNFLEVGAGRGDFFLTIMQYINTGDAIDFSENVVSLLKERVRSDRSDIICGDFLSYQFKKKYSLIIMFEVLEHIKDDYSALEKINNLLEDGGLFLFSVPAKMKRWSANDEIAGHYRRYEKQELLEKMIKHNFHVMKIISYGFPIANLLAFCRNLIFKIQRRKDISIIDKEAQSKKSGFGPLDVSGFNNIINLGIKILFCDFLLRLYLQIAKPFNNFDFGDGYLCLVEKIKSRKENYIK